MSTFTIPAGTPVQRYLYNTTGSITGAIGELEFFTYSLTLDGQPVISEVPSVPVGTYTLATVLEDQEVVLGPGPHTLTLTWGVRRNFIWSNIPILGISARGSITNLRACPVETEIAINAPEVICADGSDTLSAEVTDPVPGGTIRWSATGPGTIGEQSGELTPSGEEGTIGVTANYWVEGEIQATDTASVSVVPASAILTRHMRPQPDQAAV